MKITHKENAIERKNSDYCLVTEYPKWDEALDFAIVRLNGRYPEEQRVTNTMCKEIVYVQEGQGAVEVEGKRYSLKAGDVVLIEVGEKFFWEGEMTLFISCRPAFYIEQHQAVE
jgi:mannose-6-phosphate isomerase-like protein (cupin superfamily)